MLSLHLDPFYSYLFLTFEATQLVLAGFHSVGLFDALLIAFFTDLR